MKRLTHNTNLEASSTRSWSSLGWGWTIPGRWQTGLYTVELSIDAAVIASGQFTVVSLPIPLSDSFLELRKNLPWAIGTLSYDDLRDLETLSSLMRKDRDLTATVASLPWVKQGLTEETRVAFEYLALLAGQDPVLARKVAGLFWIADDITQDERTSLKYLTLLARRDPSLARTVAAYPWAAYGISQQERQTMEIIAFFAGEDPTLAKGVAGFPWVADGITQEELVTLGDLRELATQDVSLVRELTGRNWVIYDITGDDRFALWSLKNLALADPSLAKYVAGHPWVTDDITPNEAWALNHLKDLQTYDASLGTTVASLPWFTDNISERERWALRYLADIAKQDVPLAKALAGLPWMKFDLSEEERQGLNELSNFLVQNAALAKQVANMPFLTTSFEAHDRDALSSLLYLGVNYADTLSLLTQQEWFLDGLDDLEAAFVAVVGTPQGQFLGPDNLSDLVRTFQGETRPVVLPRVGEIQLIIFHSEPGPNSLQREKAARLENAGRVVDQLEESLRIAEDLMGVPFPKSEVILLIVPPRELNLGLDFDYLDLDRGTHMVIDPNLARQGAANRVVIHQVAHYYWGTGEAPLWFREGAAEFMTAYLADKLYGEPLQNRAAYALPTAVASCAGLTMTTIQRLIDQLAIDGFSKHQKSAYFTCNHRLGENLFLKLYQTLGPGPFSAAWKELYQSAKREERPITENEIYQAFLRHTTEATVGEFEELYSVLHGGDFRR